MKKKTIVFIAVLLITMMASSSAFAGAGWCGSKCDKGQNKAGAVMSKLGLTPDQEKSLKENRTAHREELKALFQELKQKKGELKDALARTDVSKRDIEPLVADIKKLQGKLMDKRVEGIFRVKSILTPEQFNKFQEMKERKMKHRKDAKHGRKEWRS